MSWGVYCVQKTSRDVRQYVASLNDQHMPREAKVLVSAALDASGVEDENPRLLAVKLSASGHKPNGTTKIEIEPVFSST